MRRTALFVALLLPTLALAGDSWTTPTTGIKRLHRTTSSPKWNINALVVDLDTPGVKLEVTPFAQKGRRTSTFGAGINAKAAVNGDFFGGTYLTTGLTIGKGAQWAGTRDQSGNGVIRFNTDVSRIEYGSSGNVTAEPWMYGAISGHPSLLSNGEPRSFTSSLCTARHPRTAAGLSADKRTLYLAVVDGRQTASVGMTCAELATLMKGLGARTAVNFDGGGSSTMWLSGAGIVNKPSDGSERVVANHLAIVISPVSQPTTGELIGAVFEAPNTAARLPGATVKLQDGRTATADANGIYRFQLPAGSWTATATHSGFQPASVTRTVTANGQIWGSIGLTRPQQPVDTDSDGTPDENDNCPEVSNWDQANLDGDESGDLCDGDDDGDGWFDEDDNCERASNSDQADLDDDGAGDACDDTDDREPDAGVIEEPIDAGVEEPVDAGSEEPIDAGTEEPVDAGTTTPDAGTPADEKPHVPSHTEPMPQGGCAQSGATLLALLGLGWSLRNRRSRS